MNTGYKIMTVEDWIKMDRPIGSTARIYIGKRELIGLYPRDDGLYNAVYGYNKVAVIHPSFRIKVVTNN